MDYEGLIEQNVNHMMEKMFGDKDPALKTITKMNILFDGDEETKSSMEHVLTKMKKMNYYEAKCIEDEMFLTYDNAGNIISVNDIKNEPKDKVFDESKSESHTDFISSNR